MFVVLQCASRGLQDRSVRIDTPVQERVRDLLVEFPRKGCPGDDVVQEALREMVKQGRFVKQRSAVRTVQPSGTHSRHGSNIALDGGLIGVGEQLPRRVKLET